MTSFAPFSSLWPRFITLLNGLTGLQVRDKDRAMVLAALETRRKALGLTTPERYLELLEANKGDGEWKNLLPLLTNGESYFLRDSRQFSLLRRTILPELLSERAQKRQLRLWSAGCSTGEEVYSLAMLVDELAPRSQGWNIVVLGTDINEASLTKARNGVYNQWSFRGVSDEIKERYFQRIGNTWKVNARLRSIVEFRPLNLRSSDYPDRASGLSDIDLILCRNVLIYLSSEAVAHALQGFTNTLREGGFLLTGHAELAHHTMSLQARLFPESVAYQKSKPTDLKPESPVSRPTLPRPGASTARVSPHVPRTPIPRPNLSPAPTARPVGVPPVEVRPVEVRPAEARSAQVDAQKNQVADLCELARREANLGRYNQAVASLREAVSLDPVNPDAYSLWAQIVSEQGDDEEAKRLWKKVVFLAPSRVDAWLDLGELYAASGDMTRAKRMRQTALELLQALPKDALVHHGTTVKAEDLAGHVAGLLGLPDSRPSNS